jgi:WD40 repeat protein
LQFSPDGATLAVITRDNVIRLCDPATGKLRVKLGPLWLRYWTFSADSKTLLALPRNGTQLHVWDAATGKLLANGDLGFAGQANNLGARPEAALSPDGKTYAAGGGSTFVQLRDTITGAVRATFMGHKHPIRDLAFSPDGKTLATLDVQQSSPGSESNVKLWDAAEEEPIGLPFDTSPVTALGRAPDGQTLAVGFANGTIRLYEADSLNVRSVLRNKASRVDVLWFSADGGQLAASHRGDEKEDNIDVWDLAAGKVTASFPGYLKSFEGQIVAAVASLAEPRSFPEPPDTITLWNVTTKKRVVEAMDSHRKHFAMTRDGQMAVTVVDVGRRFKLWNVADGKERLTLPDLAQGNRSSPSVLRFSPDGKYLAVGDEFSAPSAEGAKQWTYQCAGRLYDTATGKERSTFPLAFQNRGAVGEPEDNWTLAEFSPDGELLVAVSSETNAFRARAVLWDVAAGKELATLPNPEKLVVVYAAFSPDSKTLATMTFGEWKRDHFPEGQWDAKGKIRMQRSEPNSSGHAGAPLTSMSPVYEIHVWDVATRERRNRFIVSWQGKAAEMAFSGDGQSIYVVINHESGIYGVPPVNRLQVWDVKTGAERGSIGEAGARFHALAYTADGRLLALTEQRLNTRRPEQYPSSYKVRIWDATRNEELAAPQLFTATEMPLDLDPELLTVAPDTPPEKDAWDDVFSFGAHSSTATSPDGKLKAVRGHLPFHSTGPGGKVTMDPGSTDVVLGDVTTGEVLYVLRSYGQSVCRLAFSPDGKTLAVGESSGKIQLWNVAAGRLLLTIPAHSGPVTGLAFRADGRVLASCSDSEIRLWRAATDEDVARQMP